MNPATLDDSVVTSPPDIGVIGRFDEPALVHHDQPNQTAAPMNTTAAASSR